jgi:hypothetical protein
MKLKGKRPTAVRKRHYPFEEGSFVIAKNGSIGRIVNADMLACTVFWSALDGRSGNAVIFNTNLTALDEDVARALLQHRKYEKQINNKERENQDGTL